MNKEQLEELLEEKEITIEQNRLRLEGTISLGTVALPNLHREGIFPYSIGVLFHKFAVINSNFKYLPEVLEVQDIIHLIEPSIVSNKAFLDFKNKVNEYAAYYYSLSKEKQDELNRYFREHIFKRPSGTYRDFQQDVDYPSDTVRS